ncbi:AAA family ATPase [Anaerosinus sp.]|uniref:AAA family ATPase n=1 Tax=Selenobaculum sp. TaxID=3074374 RepID=UPI003AB5CE1E
MKNKYNVSEIFQPASFPEYTYVSRKINERETYEGKLRKALDTKGVLSFVTGASKSGKTVLCHSAIAKDDIVEVSGSHIRSLEDFWIQIAENLFLPVEVEVTSGDNKEFSLNGELSAKSGIPLIATGNVRGSAGFKESNISSTKEKQQRGIKQIIEYMKANNKVLVIDDFHYIEESVQLSIARILKNEIFDGLKAIVISLPHRSDDAIRLNPDLNGRVRFINIKNWTEEELIQIPLQGFKLLNYDIKSDVMQFMALESLTSPHLMQQICLSLSYYLQDGHTQSSINVGFLKGIFQEITEDMQFENIIGKIISGPSHGKENRRTYTLRNGEKHDIYYVILKALAQNPPVIEINIEDMQLRVQSIIDENGEMPRKSDISNALGKIQKILNDNGYRFEYLEWREQKLNILDSLFMFYLRWK